MSDSPEHPSLPTQPAGPRLFEAEGNKSPLNVLTKEQLIHQLAIQNQALADSQQQVTALIKVFSEQTAVKTERDPSQPPAFIKFAALPSWSPEQDLSAFMHLFDTAVEDFSRQHFVSDREIINTFNVIAAKGGETRGVNLARNNSEANWTWPEFRELFCTELRDPAADQSAWDVLSEMDPAKYSYNMAKFYQEYRKEARKLVHDQNSHRRSVELFRTLVYRYRREHADYHHIATITNVADLATVNLDTVVNAAVAVAPARSTSANRGGRGGTRGGRGGARGGGTPSVSYAVAGSIAQEVPDQTDNQPPQ